MLDCQGTYFVTCDCAGLGLGDDDAEICRTLTVEAGQAGPEALAAKVRELAAGLGR